MSAQATPARGMTLADAGRRITAEHAALIALLEVAERDVSRGLGSGSLRAAAITAREAQR